MRRSSAIWFLALSAALVLQGPAAGQSLDRALSEAWRTSPQLDADRARQRQRDELLPQAAAGMAPRVNVDGSLTATTIGNSGLTPDFRGVPGNFQTSVTQPLFDGGRTRTGVARARAEIEAGRAQLSDREQDLLLQTAVAYATLRRERDTLAHRERLVATLSTESRRISARASAGDLSRTDRAQARTRLEEAIVARDQARADLAAATAEFQRLVGSPAGRLAQPALRRDLLPRSEGETLALARSHNPSLVAAVLARVAADRQVDAARTENGPSLSARGAVGIATNTPSGLDRQTTQEIGVRFSMPLFDGGVTRSRVREARAAAEQREAEARVTLAQIDSGALRVYRQWQSNQARLTSAGRQISAAEAALRGVRIEERIGERQSIDVLNAERDLASARIAVAAADRDVTVSAYALLALVGRLSPQALGIAGPAIADAARPVSAPMPASQGGLVVPIAAPRQHPFASRFIIQ